MLVTRHPFGRARTWRVGLTLLAGLLGPALAAPVSGHAASSFYYLGFDDRLSTVGYEARDWVSYTYSGNAYVNRRPQLQVLRGDEIIVEVVPAPWEPDYGQRASVPGLVVGDVLRVSDVVSGAIYAQATYGGRPVFDEGPCGAVTTLRGLRSEGAEISGAGAYSADAGDSYSSGSSLAAGSIIEGDGPGTRLEVEFDDPVKPGLVVWAEEHVAISNTVAVRTFREQRVRPCAPGKPVVAATTPTSGTIQNEIRGASNDTRAPVATVTRPRGLSKRSLAQLVTPNGLNFRIKADEPATVVVRITLHDQRNGKRRTRDAGSVTWQLAGGATNVPVALARKARSVVRSAGRRGGARLSYRFVLTDAAGNAGAAKTIDVKLPRR